jgi:FHS family L-fucose permease-like MFS transporter
MNMVQAFNSVGTTLAPYLGGLLFLSNQVQVSAGETMSTEDKLAAASAVKAPYVVMAIVLAILAFVLSRLKLSLPESMSGKATGATGSVWQHRHLVLGALGIFCYVGAEVSIASILVNYLSQANIGGLTEANASVYLSVYWGLMIIGRFAGTAILRKIAGGKLLGTVGVIAFLLVLTTILTSGSLAMIAVVAVGLFNFVMFPTIFSLAVTDLGPLTGKGSGLINMAIVGGAVVPPLQGALADSIGIQMSFIIPAICYLYILFYGFSGSKVQKTA